MKLNDRVKFLNENLEGVITRIIDDKTLGVSIEDGFEIPVLKSEVVALNTAPVGVPAKAAITSIKTNRQLEAGLYIVLEQRFGTLYYCKLLNNGHDAALITVYVERDGHIRHQMDGKMQRGELLVLENLDMGDHASWPTLHIQSLPVIMLPKSLPEPQKFEFKYRSRDLVQGETQDGKVFHYIQLLEGKYNPISKAIAPPVRIPEREVAPRIMMERPSEVIDLHIEKLTTNPDGMNADEALQLQMQTFENNFEKALSMNYDKITFIHGVGNGTLKLMIRKKLSSTKDIRSFRDAMKEKFGFGATEIFFK
jgi:hypothetical protein